MEHTETLAELRLVAFRRLGANRVHFALVMPGILNETTHWGADCTVARGPITAWCGRTLRGDKFVIPDENLDEWKQQGHVCDGCRVVALMGLRRAEART